MLIFQSMFVWCLVLAAGAGASLTIAILKRYIHYYVLTLLFLCLMLFQVSELFTLAGNS